MLQSMKLVFLALCLFITYCLAYWIGFTNHLHRDIYSGIFEECMNQEPQLETYTVEPINSNINFNNNNVVSTTLPNNITIPLYITGKSLRTRIGNRIFQYASLLGIAQTQGRKLFAIETRQLKRTFKLRYSETNETVKDLQWIEEKSPYTFDTKLINLPKQNFIIMGYLQSYKYFVSIADYLRYEFTFHDSIASAAAVITSDVRAKYTATLIVGVHVRRGDFLIPGNKELGYIIPERSYFINAFNYMTTFFSGRNITFVVVSNDLPWCSTNLNVTNVVIVPPASASVHLAVLASCDHVIISSGTYSWWGAYLSGGHVIYFTGYMSKNTTQGKKFSSEDYYPSHWIGFGN